MTRQRRKRTRYERICIRLGAFSFIAFALFALQHQYGEVITTSAIAISTMLHMGNFIEEVTD